MLSPNRAPDGRFFVAASVSLDDPDFSIMRERPMPSSETRKPRSAAKTHSMVWNQIRAIACKQGGCHYRSVKVADSRFDPREKSKARPGFPALNAGQEAMVNDPDTVKVMGREYYCAVPVPSEVKNTNDPFDHARFDHAMITEPALP